MSARRRPFPKYATLHPGAGPRRRGSTAAWQLAQRLAYEAEKRAEEEERYRERRVVSV